MQVTFVENHMTNIPVEFALKRPSEQKIIKNII
jgi:hypothetical protein